MIFKQLNRIQQIDKLIRQQRTGNASEFANKLGISRRQIYNCIEEMKDWGMKIEYDRVNQTFYYKKNYRIHLTFNIEGLNHAEMLHYNAGINLIPNNYRVQGSCTTTAYL